MRASLCLRLVSRRSLAPCRFSNDPAAHAALGFFLLSTTSRHDVGDAGGLENLDRAIAAFRRSMVVSRAGRSIFVPATRGLAVAVRRHRLSTGCTCREDQPSRGAGDAPTINDGDRQQVGRLRYNVRKRSLANWRCYSCQRGSCYEVVLVVVLFLHRNDAGCRGTS